MSEVTVRFVGGPAHDLVRALPGGADGTPPDRWVLRHPVDPAAPEAHLYERDRPVAGGGWTMRYVRTDPYGITE